MTLLASLMGVVVVLFAFGLLALGAFALIGGGIGGSPSAPASAAALTSPSPTPSADASRPADTSPPASVIPTAPSSPTDAPATSAPPTGTPGPTFTPVVNEGPGWITFGTTVNHSLHVTDPRATFSAAEPRIVWSAHLSSPANGTDLSVLIFKLDASASGGEKKLWDTPVHLNVTDAAIFQSYLRTRALSGPGVYEVRYVRGAEILAHGFFELTG